MYQQRHLNMSRIKLLIDTRETIQDLILGSSVIPFDEMVVQPLPLGDYVFEVDGTPQLVIERKTVVDLASSIRDGRHREQKERLKASYRTSQVVFLVEGNLGVQNSGFKFNHVDKQTIMSSIFNTMFRDGFHVFHTSHERDTLWWLESLYMKWCKQPEELLAWISSAPSDSTKDQPVDTYLVDQMTAKKPKLSAIKSENKSLDVVFLSQLEMIPGVSRKTALGIQEKHTTMAGLITHLQSLGSRSACIDYLYTCRTADCKRKPPTNTVEMLLDVLGLYPRVSTEN